MKKLITTLAIVTMASLNVMASTARMSALQGPIHLIDATTVFGNPTDSLKLPEVALIEYGAASTFGSSAQGGFLKSMDDSKFGFFIGNGSTTRTTAAAGTLDFEGVENPFTVIYGSKAGDLSWGLALSYSNSAKKADIAAVAGATYANLDSATQAKTTLTGSVEMGSLNFGATLGLGDTAKTTLKNATADSASYKGGSTSLFAYYGIESWTLGLELGLGTTKIDKTVANTASSVKDATNNKVALRAVNEIKKEGAAFFYGASLVMDTTKDVGATATTTTTENTLPVIIGVEADAASWMVLRGSITQNVLYGVKSTKVTDTVTDSTSHNTNVNAGLGFKFNKSVLDMTLSAATNGTVASNALGASAAYTYMF